MCTDLHAQEYDLWISQKEELVTKFKENKDQDPIFLVSKINIHKQRVLTFEQEGDGILKYQGKFCVPGVNGLQERIMEEANSSTFSINSVFTKMYRDLRELYWCECKKKGIVEFVAKCINVLQVKVKHERTGSLAVSIKLTESKWEIIKMYFII